MNNQRSSPHMKSVDVLRIAIRMIRTNLLRSTLTILGISIAIMFIVILIGFGYGIQSLTIGSIVKSKALLSLDVKADVKQQKPLTESALTELKILPGVTGATPVIQTFGQLKIDDQLAAVSVEAGNEQYLEMEGIQLQSGRAYKDRTREMVIAPQTLELLNIPLSNVVGKTVSLTYTDPNNDNTTLSIDNLIVVGVSGPADGPAIYVPIDVLNPDGKSFLSAIKLVAKTRSDLIAVRTLVTAKGYQVESLLETLDAARRIFGWATVGLATFGAIALIVASIGMFNTLTIALIERTREIGIMKAIGVTDKSIRGLFLAEAAVIGFFGGLVGIIMGYSVGSFLELILNQYGQTYQAANIALFQYPPGFLIGILIFPILLAMVTGLYPAIRASKLNPLQALRYE